MKKHEETIQMIDLKIQQHEANISISSEAEYKAERRERVEELKKTKMKLVLDQENTGS